MYDAVIIGAGIGGLVCGCCLAKAGLKVLIAEQHFKPGGYCTSFQRSGFTFDAAAHSFGGYRQEGILRKVFDDLGVDKVVPIKRVDPTNTITTPDHTASFWCDRAKTVDDFASCFPHERNNLNRFFDFLTNPEPMSFARMRSWTFNTLLDQHFTNDTLKSILSAPLLGNGGLPPSMMSVFIGAKLFSEFLFDGGYYPEGGMQALPDALSKIFREHGGELRLSSKVKKITENDRCVTGILFDRGDYIPSKYVISDCDARQTFYKLLGKDKIHNEFRNTFDAMLPTTSNFIGYLGIDGYFNALPKAGTSQWFLSHYDLDKAYRAVKKCDIEGFGAHMVRVSQDNTTILAIIPAPFKNRKYWSDNKYKVLDTLIERIEKYTIPDLSKHITYKEAASPHTLYRYTLNRQGSSFGWAGTPSQLALSDFRKPSFMRNLYLTGHWTTFGIGISGVVYVGQDTAKRILKKEKGSV